jgi:hypothetical protein
MTDPHSNCPLAKHFFSGSAFGKYAIDEKSAHGIANVKRLQKLSLCMV